MELVDWEFETDNPPYTNVAVYLCQYCLVTKKVEYAPEVPSFEEEESPPPLPSLEEKGLDPIDPSELSVWSEEDSSA